MVEEAKEFHKLDSESQSIMALTQLMFTYTNSRNYEELVATMINLKVSMISIEKRQESADIERQAMIK